MFKMLAEKSAGSTPHHLDGKKMKFGELIAKFRHPTIDYNLYVFPSSPF
jgi:hypothetical protein